MMKIKLVLTSQQRDISYVLINKMMETFAITLKISLTTQQRNVCPKNLSDTMAEMELISNEELLLICFEK